MRRLVVTTLLLGLAVVPTPGNAVDADRATASWQGVDVPYLQVEDARTQRRPPKVRFHDTKVEFPFRDGILTMAATADSALVMANDYCYAGCHVQNGHTEFFEGPLLEISAGGTTGMVERRSLGIPLADPLGHTAYWTKRAKRRVRLVGYVTSTHTKVLGPVLARHSRVFAVDGDTAYLNVNALDGPPTAWSWTVGDAEPQPVPLPPSRDPEDGRFLADVSHGRILSADWGDGPSLLSDTAGNVLAEVPVFLGTFSPNGRFVAQTWNRRVKVLDLETGATLIPKGLGKRRSFDYRWAPDGRLVLVATPRRGHDDANAAYRFVCTLPDARCTRLVGRSALFYEQQLESSSLGQFVALLAPYVSRSSKAPERYLRQN